MRILITGAAGFLGSHLCYRLLKEGHEVVGLDNFITGNPDNIAHLMGNEKFSFQKHDVSNYIFVRGKVDAVLHFASPPSPNPQSPSRYFNLPIQTMKAGALDTHIARIFNTYGPRMDLEDGRALPNFLKQALLGQPLTVYGDGGQTRSFCYVDDLIEGIVCLLYSEEHLPVNIGNQHEMSILQFAETINEIVGNKAGLTFVKDARSVRDPQRRQPDISRARQILGW